MSPTPCPVALAHYFQTLLSSSFFKFPYLQAPPSMRSAVPTGIIVLANSAKSNGDTKLAGSVDLLESRRLCCGMDQDRLDGWAEAISVRVNKAKCWVLSLSHNHPLAEQQPGAEGLEICTEGKVLGVLVTVTKADVHQDQGSDCHPTRHC